MTLTDAFTYNQHFVAMMNIINMARLNPPESGHKHHIIPRCWFRMNNIPIDNSEANLVLLSYEDHGKIHKLMSLCSITEELSQKMICAYNMLMKGTVLGSSYKLTQDTKNKMSESHKGKHHSEETRRKISEALKGNKMSENNRIALYEAHKGKKQSVETCKKRSESLKGRTFSEEHRRKISEAIKRIWAMKKR